MLGSIGMVLPQAANVRGIEADFDEERVQIDLVRVRCRQLRLFSRIGLGSDEQGFVA